MNSDLIIGFLAKNGVVVATEKKFPTLMDESSIQKVVFASI